MELLKSVFRRGRKRHQELTTSPTVTDARQISDRLDRIKRLEETEEYLRKHVLPEQNNGHGEIKIYGPNYGVSITEKSVSLATLKAVQEAIDRLSNEIQDITSGRARLEER